MPRPLLVGILNITEDSFSDGGRYLDPAAAIAQARRLVAGGADIVELGAAASNIAAKAVTAEEEIRRLNPVIAALNGHGVPVSIDAFQPETQRFALAQGAAYLNDIQGFPDAATKDSGDECWRLFALPARHVHNFGCIHPNTIVG